MGGANVTKAVYLKLYFHDLGAFAVDKWRKLIINKSGRSFESGKALSPDFRRLIIDKILEEGGDRTTREIPCGYAHIARYFKVVPNTIKKI